MTALSCRVPTVTSNLSECWLAIWYCFMSLSIKLIDPSPPCLRHVVDHRGSVCVPVIWIWYNGMITVHDGLCLRVRWCGPSSYAYTDCGCDWAVYVKVALKEVQSNLIKGICNWVTAKDSAAKHTGMYACKHRDHVQYCMQTQALTKTLLHQYLLWIKRLVDELRL